MQQGNGERKKFLKGELNQKKFASIRFMSSGHWVKVNENNDFAVSKNCQVSIFSISLRTLPVSTEDKGLRENS